MIFDFDDWSIDHDCREQLIMLREINPEFKVTLFTVPGKTTIEMLEWARMNKNWIELAVHGWEHLDNYECKMWTADQCAKILDIPAVQMYFTKGFKAPGWQISTDCYDALISKGFWVADQPYNDDRRPKELPVYKLLPNSYHGHTWDCGCNNGIYEDWDNIVNRVREAGDFKLISEVMNETSTM